MDEPKILTEVLAYFWGEPWSTSGKYPEWNRYSDEQKEEIIGLNNLVKDYAKEIQEELDDVYYQQSMNLGEL